jgi:hypothetical protein
VEEWGPYLSERQWDHSLIETERATDVWSYPQLSWTVKRLGIQSKS